MLTANSVCAGAEAGGGLYVPNVIWWSRFLPWVPVLQTGKLRHRGPSCAFFSEQHFTTGCSGQPALQDQQPVSLRSPSPQPCPEPLKQRGKNHGGHDLWGLGCPPCPTISRELCLGGTDSWSSQTILQEKGAHARRPGFAVAPPPAPACAWQPGPLAKCVSWLCQPQCFSLSLTASICAPGWCSVGAQPAARPDGGEDGEGDREEGSGQCESTKEASPGFQPAVVGKASGRASSPTSERGPPWARQPATGCPSSEQVTGTLLPQDGGRCPGALKRHSLENQRNTDFH